MAYNDDLPTWGATGSKPSDGTSRSPGDNINASEYNYLWYILNETFGDIDTDVSNIETGGVADDPHGNGAHDPDFLPEIEYDPAGDIDFSQLLLNNPHDNDAHSETYLTDTYDPSTDLNFPSILEQTGNKHDNEAHSENYATTAQLAEKADYKHGNGAHSTDFLPSGDYKPVTTVENETSALNIDISGDADTVDGNEASDFIKSGEDLKIGTDEIYLEDPNLDTNGDGIDIFDVQSHFADFESPSGTYRDLLQTVYAFDTVNDNPPERDGDGDIRLDAAVQSGFYTMTFGIRSPLSNSKIRIRGEPIVMQNHAGNTLAKIDSDGNLEIAGSVTENVTF